MVLFYHDSDSDYRETITIMRDRQTGEIDRLNFLQENKIQKKYSPFYAKRVRPGWKTEILKQLPRFVDKPMIDLFESVEEGTVANFCLAMYQKMGLLEGIEVVRSSDKKFRIEASELQGDFFVDVEYEGETVRARNVEGRLVLLRGGGKTIELPRQQIEKPQKSPAARGRFAWMQSVVHATHYIMGEGEKDYLDTDEYNDVQFVNRLSISHKDMAWTDTMENREVKMENES